MKYSVYRKETLLLLVFISFSALWMQWSSIKEIRLSVKGLMDNALETKTWGKENFEKLETRMHNRLQYIREICSNDIVKNFKALFKLKAFHSSIFTLNRTGICMCKVPKASSTFFGKALLLIRDQNTTDEIKGLSGFDIHGRMFQTYSEECDTETEPIFFVTRNPYTRLFSAYIDKIFIPKFWKLALSLSYYANDVRIKQNLRASEYREIETAKGDCYKDDVSFDVFLRYVTATQQMDPHFTPVSMLCDPCIQNYTAIIKQEDFKEESLYMLEKFGVKPEIQDEIKPLLDKELAERSVQNLFDTVHQITQFVKIRQGCKIPFFIYTRIWQAMQILGYIDMNEPFPASVFSNGLIGAYEKLKQRNIKFLNSSERKIQRNVYLRNSYRSVDPKTIRRVQQLFQLDFKMFGYNETPPA